MKNYRIIRILSFAYPPVLGELFKKHPNFIELSYQEQKQIYFLGKFIDTDGFSRNMNLLGNDCLDIVYDLEVMQKSWAREHNLNYGENSWQYEILVEQLNYYKPDVLYFQGGNRLLYNFNFKDTCPSIKLLAAFYGFPHLEAKGADFLLAGYPLLYDEFKKQGIETYLVYHSFDDNILEAINSRQESKDLLYDFTFVGSSGYGWEARHHSRYWYLRELIEKTDLKLWLYEPARVQYKNITFPEKFRAMEPLRELFPEKCSPPLCGLDMYKVLSRSKVTFNRHPEFTVDESLGNMRLFEATGVRACLLSDRGDNISNLFEENKEIVTYASIEEAIEKVNYLLGHEDERKAIAAAGQKRTLKDHTVRNRCEEINAIFQKKL